MQSLPRSVRLPSPEETIAPVTIFDSLGAVVGVVSAEEFRRRHPVAAASDGSRPVVRRRRHTDRAPVSH